MDMWNDICLHCRYYKTRFENGRLVEKCTNSKCNSNVLHFRFCVWFKRSLKSFLGLVKE